MNLDDRLSQLVRDAIMPMLAEHLDGLEDRLVERLAAEVQRSAEPPKRPELLTSKDVAGILKVDPRTLQRMVSAEKFPASIKISPARSRWRRSDVDAWLAQRGGESG